MDIGKVATGVVGRNKHYIFLLFSLILIAFFITGCGNGREEDDGIVSGPAIGWIEKPTAVDSFLGETMGNSDNLVEHVVLWLEESTLTEDPVEPTGLAFTTEVSNQHGTFGGGYIETITYLYVLEFTFPITDYEANIDWTAQTEFNCSYKMTNYGDTRAFFDFDYIIFGAPFGLAPLGDYPNPILTEQIKLHTIDDFSYTFRQVPFGKLEASDKLEGTYRVMPGQEGRLYLGVRVMIRAWDEGNTMQVGINGTGSGLDWCTFEVKNSSPSGDPVWYGPEYSIVPPVD